MKWKCAPIGKKNVYKNVVNEYITYQKPSCSRWAWTLVGLVSCTFSLIARSLSWTLSVGRWRCPRLPFLITRCVSLSFFSLKVWRFSSRWKKSDWNSSQKSNALKKKKMTMTHRTQTTTTTTCLLLLLFLLLFALLSDAKIHFSETFDGAFFV